VSEATLPNFTGIWKLDLAKSVLRGPAPARLLIKIRHREPELIQAMIMKGAGGSDVPVQFVYQTGKVTTNSVRGFTVRTHAQWQGAELLLESTMDLAGRRVRFNDYWSLSEDGNTLTMAHRDDDLAGQVSVLEKVGDNPEAGLR
jgi:hypothetical protein